MPNLSIFNPSSPKHQHFRKDDFSKLSAARQSAVIIVTSLATLAGLSLFIFGAIFIGTATFRGLVKRLQPKANPITAKTNRIYHQQNDSTSRNSPLTSHTRERVRKGIDEIPVENFTLKHEPESKDQEHVEYSRQLAKDEAEKWWSQAENYEAKGFWSLAKQHYKFAEESFNDAHEPTKARNARAAVLRVTECKKKENDQKNEMKLKKHAQEQLRREADAKRVEEEQLANAKKLEDNFKRRKIDRGIESQTDAEKYEEKGWWSLAKQSYNIAADWFDQAGKPQMAQKARDSIERVEASEKREKVQKEAKDRAREQAREEEARQREEEVKRQGEAAHQKWKDKYRADGTENEAKAQECELKKWLFVAEIYYNFAARSFELAGEFDMARQARASAARVKEIREKKSAKQERKGAAKQQKAEEAATKPIKATEIQKIIQRLDALLAKPNSKDFANFIDDMPKELIRATVAHVDTTELNIANEKEYRLYVRNFHPDKIQNFIKNQEDLKVKNELIGAIIARAKECQRVL